MLHIPVDFNTMNMDVEQRRIVIDPRDTNVVKHLQPGLRVWLYADGDMGVEAIIEFDERYQRWMGKPDWETMRDL